MSEVTFDINGRVVRHPEPATMSIGDAMTVDEFIKHPCDRFPMRDSERVPAEREDSAREIRDEEQDDGSDIGERFDGLS
jgi:hypothetical protein